MAGGNSYITMGRQYYDAITKVEKIDPASKRSKTNAARSARDISGVSYDAVRLALKADNIARNTNGKLANFNSSANSFNSTIDEVKAKTIGGTEKVYVPESTMFGGAKVPAYEYDRKIPAEIVRDTTSKKQFDAVKGSYEKLAGFSQTAKTNADEIVANNTQYSAISDKIKNLVKKSQNDIKPTGLLYSSNDVLSGTATQDVIR